MDEYVSFFPLYQQNRACVECGLRSLCQGPVPAEGPPQVRIAMAGESPGEGEDRSGRPFRGPAGQFLDQLFNWYLEQVNIKRQDVLITNLVKCRPPDNDFDIAKEHKADKICPSLWLEEELKLAQPQIIVALGAQAARYFLGYRFQMDSDHGFPSFQAGRIIFPIFHPAAGFHDSRHLRNTMADFKGLAELVSLLDSGLSPALACREMIPQDPHHGKEQYQLVTTTEHALQLLSQPYYAIDTETIPTIDGQKLWSIQVSSASGQAYFIPANLVPDPQTAIPSSSVVLVHNWLYDQQFINIPTYLDTMMMAYLVQYPLGLKDLAWRLCGMEMHDYSEYTRPYRKEKALSYLKEAARTDWGSPPDIPPEWEWDNKKRELILKAKKPHKLNRKILDRMDKALSDDTEYDPYIKWRDVDSREKVHLERKMGPMLDASLEDAPFDDAMFYSCRDPDATWRIAPILLMEVERLGVHRVLTDLDLPTLRFAREMMDLGMGVDSDRLQQLSDKCIEQMKQTVDEMEEVMEGLQDNFQLSSQHALPYISPQGVNFRFNPNSPLQTAKYVLGWDGRGKQPNTEEREMKQLDHPAAKYVVEYRQNAKIKDSYADKLIPFIDSESRVHCDVFPAGTETGRLRMSNPPLQAIPTRTALGLEVRKAFKATRPGYVILCIDYSQIEMRVLADISGCANLIRIFQAGGDAHTLMACRIFGVTEEEVWANERLYRYPVKRLHFGVVYGITAVGLYNGMIEEGAEGWEIPRCQGVIDLYYEENPEIKDYTESQFAHGRHYGFVRDPYFGRIRYVPEIHVPVKWIAAEGERQAANMPIAAAAQGILKTATKEIMQWREEVWNKYHPEKPIWMINQVHDELMMEVPEEHAELIAFCCKSMMEQVGVDLVKVDGSVGMQVPIVAECKIGENWGDAKKVEMKELVQI